MNTPNFNQNSNQTHDGHPLTPPGSGAVLLGRANGQDELILRTATQAGRVTEHNGLETGENLAAGQDHGHQGRRHDSAGDWHQLTVDLLASNSMAPSAPPADDPTWSLTPHGQSAPNLPSPLHGPSQLVAAKEGCPENQSSSYTDHQASSWDQGMGIDAFLDVAGSGMHIEDKQQSNGVNPGKPEGTGASTSQAQASPEAEDIGSGALEVFVRNEMGKRPSATAGDSSAELQQSSMVAYGVRKRSRTESLAGEGDDEWMEGSGIVERYAHEPPSPGPECNTAAITMELFRLLEQMNSTVGRLQEYLVDYHRAQDSLRRKNRRLERHNRTLVQENTRLSTEIQSIFLQSGGANLSLVFQLASSHAELRAARQQVVDLNNQHKAELAVIHDFYLSQAQLSDPRPDSS